MSNCGVEYISETGHSLSELIGEVPATCYSVGVLAHYACLECGELFDSNNQPTTKEALEFTRDHAYGELREYTAPTCTAPGFIAHYECSLCLGNFNEDREKIDDIFISAVGHIGGTATCLSGAVCESCDAVYTDPDLTNHSYGVALRYDESTHWKECICGAKSSLCGHILSDKILEEPTESEMGILDSSCVCGYNTRKYIPKLPPKAEGNIENANPFPPLKLIIITASAILLCICVAAIVIIVRKLKKQ